MRFALTATSHVPSLYIESRRATIVPRPERNVAKIDNTRLKTVAAGHNN